MLITEKTPVDTALYELLPHGSAEFPMVVELIDFRHQVDGCVNWHWHEDVQFFLLLEGEVEFFVNKTRHILRAGEGLFINSGILHMARALTKEKAASYYCLDISPVLLSLFANSVFEKRYVRPYLRTVFFEGLKLIPQVDWQKEILENIPTVTQLEETRPFGSEYEIVWRLTRMWLAVITHASAEKTCARDQTQMQLVSRIIGYLAEHYREEITLTAVADYVHKSPSECCRLFRTASQMTIFSYLEKYRIERAVRLLQSTSLTVDRIASDVGFRTTSYFIKVFRRNMGKTPLAFRKSE